MSAPRIYLFVTDDEVSRVGFTLGTLASFLGGRGGTGYNKTLPRHVPTCAFETLPLENLASMRPLAAVDCVAVAGTWSFCQFADGVAVGAIRSRWAVRRTLSARSLTAARLTSTRLTEVRLLEQRKLRPLVRDERRR